MIWQLVVIAVWALTVTLLSWWVSAATRKGRRFEEQREIEMAKRRHPTARP